MASEGMRIVDDPEGLGRVVVDFYTDGWVYATCYLKAGTPLGEIQERCKRLMESIMYDD